MKIKVLQDYLLKFIFFSTFLFQISWAWAQEQTEIKGIYQAKNLIISNPFSSEGNGFCISRIEINGKPIEDGLLSNALEINFEKYGFVKNDKLQIIIYHKHGCNPLILNPEVLMPRSTFKCITIKVDRAQQLSWVTTQEESPLPFIIEQFKWNKWVQVASVLGQGGEKTNFYTVKVPVHSGINKFRVRQTDFTKKSHLSSIAIYRNTSKQVTFLPGDKKKTNDHLIFSAVTSYEIYDFYGKIILHGTADVVNVKYLSSGTYFLNYDNSTAEFIKK